MSCDGIRASYLAGGRDSHIDAHLRGCPACRRSLGDLDRVRSLLGDPGLWEVVPADLEERVMATIRAAAPPPPVRGRLLSRGRRVAAGLVVGVAAAAAIVVAAMALGGSDDPDWQVTLQPTEVAPGAAATVDGWLRDEGTEMRLEVVGLPPSGSSAHYEIWLTAPDGRHVAAGSFTSSGTITGWSGVERDDFPRIWITLEPNDDDESLSGRSVLDMPELRVRTG